MAECIGPAYVVIMTLINILTVIAMGGVLVVLVAGLINLYRTGDKARSNSNKLMRLRVMVQFAAVVLLMLGLWLKTRAA